MKKSLYVYYGDTLAGSGERLPIARAPYFDPDRTPPWTAQVQKDDSTFLEVESPKLWGPWRIIP